jgi:hypothetical protein
MAKNKPQIRNSTAEFLVFTSQYGKNTIEVRVQDETVWLTQNLIAELFQTSKQNVGQHLKNIFTDGELQENSVVKNFFTTATCAKNAQVQKSVSEDFSVTEKIK